MWRPHMGWTQGWGVGHAGRQVQRLLPAAGVPPSPCARACTCCHRLALRPSGAHAAARPAGIATTSSTAMWPRTCAQPHTPSPRRCGPLAAALRALSAQSVLTWGTLRRSMLMRGTHTAADATHGVLAAWPATLLRPQLPATLIPCHRCHLCPLQQAGQCNGCGHGCHHVCAGQGRLRGGRLGGAAGAAASRLSRRQLWLGCKVLCCACCGETGTAQQAARQQQCRARTHVHEGGGGGGQPPAGLRGTWPPQLQLAAGSLSSCILESAAESRFQGRGCDPARVQQRRPPRRQRAPQAAACSSVPYRSFRHAGM